MTALQIIGEEFKKAGLELAEKDAEVVIKTIFEKVSPRLAAESDNATVKSIFTALLVFNPMIEKMFLDMAEKISADT
jgi:hypothetical protein